MLLLQSCTAFRGESARMLLWSDLFVTEVPIPELGPNVKIPVSLLTFTFHIRCNKFDLTTLAF